LDSSEIQIFACDFNLKNSPVAVIETGLGIMAAFERSDDVFAEEDACRHNSVKTSNPVIAMFSFLLIMDN
jgi:hypothetical protein